MYLKTIDVQGFKSFANKINFEFHNGITAIVGPNGSGKSNVADAVRWVLGEQRVKQLRGGKMEDVIFAGTENRKPLGFAYVAITLDNADHQLPISYNEVTVSRRLFRSGESEYKINGITCRLKDINELFYDTGIGKEGYSIIGQGQIDKILSGKPEERRELFDEAAGIVKFKRRKAVAQKKLEDEKLNLLRVKDILSELERQLKPLESQSETAKKYLKLRDELKTYDVNMFLLEIGELKKQLQVIEEKQAIASDDLDRSREAFEVTKRDYEKLETYIEALDQNIDEKKNQRNETKLLREKQESGIQLLNEQIHSAHMNDTHLNERLHGITDSKEKLEKELSDFTHQLQATEEQLTKADSAKKAADDALTEVTEKIHTMSEKIEALKAEIIQILNDKSSVTTNIGRYETMLDQIQIRKADLNARLVKYKSDGEEQEHLIHSLETEQNSVNQIIKEETEKSEIIQKETESIKGENRNISIKLETKQQEFHREKSKLESLKNMTERYEGYGNSIRKIMELKNTKKGVIGVVADIIKVESQYEIAVETALGGNIQNVVTDTEKTAKEMIEYLKKNKFGRATFLPLSSIANKTGFTNEMVLKDKGVIGLACDIVKIDKAYEAVAKYLLGRIVVVDHIDNALVLARKHNYKLRIVTLEGELLNTGGSMSGGAFKNSSNLLGRRREIDKLKNRIENIQTETDQLRNNLEQNKIRMKSLSKESEQIRLVLSEQYLLLNTIKMNIHQADTKKQEISADYNDSIKEDSEIASQIEEMNKSNQSLFTQLNELEMRSKALEEQITVLSEQIEAEKEIKGSISRNNEEMRIEHSNLLQRHTFINENRDRIQGEIARLAEELLVVQSSVSESLAETEQKMKEIDQLTEASEHSTKQINSLEQEIQHLVADKEKQAGEHKDFFSKREQLGSQINDLDKEVYRLNAQGEKLEDVIGAQYNYMWDEYELTYNTAKQLRNNDIFHDAEIGGLTQIKKTISSLKADMKALGDVNVNAIEEYLDLTERYTFLKTQHDDLIKAEETLIKIIEELDSGMRKQFSEKFSEIRAEFDKVFKALFGGGKGTLTLNEEEDILEAGIGIIAQPPGKKLQNMMQLSGGEKALTAIALLFAIQNLKPSPFCVLDEIEAALDDSNVVRFANYLHKLTKYTQFIVITHRRGTMNAADRLYGITMQEKGISTLVSVNLMGQA